MPAFNRPSAGAMVPGHGALRHYAPPVDGDDRDIRGLLRDQAIYNPMYGDRDLGAYEMQGVSDRIFIDTFGDSALLVN
jgi:hypothetical protein